MSTPLTVTELTARIKQVLEQGFAHIEITGEISRLTTPASGHLYFTIKDAHAAISAVVWRSAAARLKTRPTEGQAYVFKGHLSLYEPRGSYQIVVQSIEAMGAGRLAAEYERRKQIFAQRGWFDAARKQAIPAFPQHLGVVASASSAAYADVKKVLQTRPAWLNITLSPCLVQGEQAPDSVVAALVKLQQCSPAPDMILLVRGGGSMEDLWCFNDERIVQAVVDCAIPIISGIGHEIDTTLTDLAADIRAATPSNAAEICCPSRNSLRQQLPKINVMAAILRRRLHVLSQQLVNTTQRQHHAINRFKDDKNWAIERLNHKHQQAFRQQLKQQQSLLKQLHTRLQHVEPNSRLRRQTHHFYQKKEHLMAFQQKISHKQRHTIDNIKHKLLQQSSLHLQTLHHQWQRLDEHLHALNPQHILKRGYAMTTNQHGKVISSSKQLQHDDLLQLHFHDGVAETKITKIHKATSPTT